MLVVAFLACVRHPPDAAHRPCNPRDVARDVELALAPQVCSADADCTARALDDWTPKLRASLADRLPDMRDWDEETRVQLVLGPATSTREVLGTLGSVLERCPTTWDGTFFTSELDYSVLPYATPGGQQLCSTTSPVPACADGTCTWRILEHLSECGP